jgi:hypothetical protein
MPNLPAYLHLCFLHIYLYACYLTPTFTLVAYMKDTFSLHPKYEGESKLAYFRRIAEILNTSPAYVKKRYYKDGQGLHDLPNVKSDKVISDFSWESVVDAAINYKDAINTTKSTQGTNLKMEIKTDKPICVVGIGDTQLGSYGTDMRLFKQITKEILETDNLYVMLLGDLTQMAVKFRGVLEMMDNLIPPKQQFLVLEDWVKTIKHKVICSVWENHAQMREENGIGWSPTAEMLAQHTAHFNGIGHIDLTVGGQEYKFAVSHFFRGRSMYNPLHAQIRYGKWEGQDREIIMAGDSHTYGVLSYNESGMRKLALNCGSIQTDSGYAKRFFSILTHPDYPCVVLDPHVKSFQALDSVASWVRLKG